MRRFLLLALGMGFLLPTAAIAEIRSIPSGAMLPTLQINDRVLVNREAFLNNSPSRGDIVMFSSPYLFDPLLRKKFPLTSAGCKAEIKHPACDEYIKRIVAVSGDRIEVNPKGEVRINGSLFNEPYISNYCTSCESFSATVPKGYVFVLGDNRGNSWDGRYWPGSPFLPLKKVLGKVETIVLPLERRKSL